MPPSVAAKPPRTTAARNTLAVSTAQSAAAAGSSDTARHSRPNRLRASHRDAMAMTMTATRQLTACMTVSVTWNPPPDAKTSGCGRSGGSQKSRASAAMRAASIITSDTPSVAATIAFGDRRASGRKTRAGEDGGDEHAVEHGHRDAEGQGGGQGQPQSLPAENRGKDHDLAGEAEDGAMREIGAMQDAR